MATRFPFRYAPKLPGSRFVIPVHLRAASKREGKVVKSGKS